MTSVNPDYIRNLVKAFDSSPFPYHMSMKLAEIDIGTAEIKLLLEDYHLQPFGIVHGGVLATLIDTSTFWAAYLKIPENAGLVNIDLKLNYLNPAVKGNLRAKGICIKSGRSISYSEAKVFDEKGVIVAHGTSTLMTLPDKGLQLNTKKFLE